MGSKRNHRDKVGGDWDEVGEWQFELLKDHGLEPEDYLLDIGCGSLRGGVNFIPYLEPRHYYGVEKDFGLIREGLAKELDNKVYRDKQPVFYSFDDFRFETRLNQTFDFILAQSVFTHLPPEDVRLCMIEAKEVMRKEATFLATYWPNDVINIGDEHPFREDEYQKVTYMNKFWQDEAEGLDLEVEILGDVGQPHGQHIVKFRE